MKELKHIKKLFKKNKFTRAFAENIVVEYENYFYKTPNISGKYLFYKWVDPYDSIHDSFKIIENTFWKKCKIAPTKIHRDKEFSCIIKQEKLNGNILSKQDLKDPIIKKEIRELLKLNKKLWKKTWLFLDILWTDCIFHPTSLHNLMIYKGHIYLFDFWLLDKNANSVIFRFFSKLFFHLQCFWIEKILIKN